MADGTLDSWRISPSSSPSSSSTPRYGPHRRVLVIGAGVAGISTAKTLLHSQPCVPPSNLVVLESHSELGGVWAEGKAYPGLASNGPRGLYGLAGHALWDPPTLPISRLVVAQEIASHLKDYAKRFGVLPRIKFGAKVASIVPVFLAGNEKPPVWHVTYDVAGTQSTIEVDLIVVATGIFSIPRLALENVKGVDQFADVPGLGHVGSRNGKKTMIVHGSELADPAMFEKIRNAGGNCVVVGFGKSALDIATHLALNSPSTRISILFRQAHFFWPFHSYAMATRSSWERLKPYYEHRSWLAWWLFETKWGDKQVEETRGKYEAVLRRVYGLKDGDPLLPEESSRYASAGGLCPVDFFPLIRKGKMGALKGLARAVTAPSDDSNNYPTLEISSLHPTCPSQLEDVRIIIMATGWSQATFPFFSPDMLEKLGLPTSTNPQMNLYRRMLPPTRTWKWKNIAFAGMYNVPVNSVAFEVGAHWIHEVFLGNENARVAQPKTDEEKEWNEAVGTPMSLPSPAEIDRRVKVFENWMVKQYIDPNAPKLAATASRVHASDTFMNWISYADDLCKDMRVKWKRKATEKEHNEGTHTADDWGTLDEERERARKKGWFSWRL